MKKFFKDIKLIIVSLVLTLVGLGLSFGLFFISQIPNLNMLTIQYIILLWIFAFVYLLIGFVWGDVIIARWRKANQEWDTKLPEDIKDKAWKARLYFYIPAVIIFVVAIVFDVFKMIAGFYPFM